jgi:hypothetical protein
MYFYTTCKYLKIGEIFLQVFGFFMHLNIDVVNIPIFFFGWWNLFS